MSRYLLIPKSINDDSKSEIFTLFPTEGFNEKAKEINVPINMIPKQSFQNHQQKKTFENFLTKMNKIGIRKNKDGLLNIENKTTDINFDDFVNDCCCKNFSICYENVYCNLREHGITF